MSDDDMFHFGREGCSHFSPDLYLLLRVIVKYIMSFSWSLSQSIILLVCQ